MSDNKLPEGHGLRGRGYLEDSARLAALHAYDALDNLPALPLRDLTRLAACVCETSMATLTLVDDARQCFIAGFGIDTHETSLEKGFCPEVVIQGKPIAIPDTTADERFSKNPVVVENNIRFYAGVPLKTSQDHIVGTVCVADTVPRQLSDSQLESLKSIARQAIDQLELRLSAQQVEQMSRALTDVSYGVAASFGGTFLAALVQHFTEVLDLEYAYVGVLASVASTLADSPALLSEGTNLSELIDSEQDQDIDRTEAIQTLVVCQKGEIIDNFSYRLSDLPCRDVLSQNSFCYNDRSLGEDVPNDSTHFPLEIDSYAATSVVDAQGRPFGVVAVMDKKPLKDPTLVRSMLTVFSVRIAAELERHQAELKKTTLFRREQAARQQAEAAVRMKDDFLAVVSHELRSPLNPIVGWAKLLRRGGVPQKKTQDALATIERNALLQVKMIDELLDASKLLRRKITLNKVPLSMSATVTAVLNKMQDKITQKSISCQLIDHSNKTMVNGDALRLQQIVEKLLNNALKFSAEKGEIKIVLTVEENEQPSKTAKAPETERYVQLQVVDTGKGISAEFLPNVFERFRQEDCSTTRQFGGLGLGLAIAQQLVKMHSGTISVQSDGLNRGATFTVKLPAL